MLMNKIKVVTSQKLNDLIINIKKNCGGVVCIPNAQAAASHLSLSSLLGSIRPIGFLAHM